MTRLQRLYDEHGQSPWLDNLARPQLLDGTLARFVSAGIRGVTANPTILARAIEGSDAGRQRRRRGGLHMGSAGRSSTGEELYDGVRLATGAGAGGGGFVAEAAIPRPSEANPPQNWQAPDIETLWEAPIVGDGGTTFGEALGAMLDPDGQFIRQLDSLGEGLAGTSGVLGLPVVGPWLGRKCCHAFHDGFVVPLAREPAPVLLDLVGGRQPAPAGALRG